MTWTETLSTKKQEPSNRIERQNNENINTTQPNITKQTLTQEDKINVELIKKHDWKENYFIIRQETRLEKNWSRNLKDKLLQNIPTDNITELNELNYAGANLASDKIGVPKRNSNRNSKPGEEIRLEKQVKKQQQQAKMLRKKKHGNMLV